MQKYLHFFLLYGKIYSRPPLNAPFFSEVLFSLQITFFLSLIQHKSIEGKTCVTTKNVFAQYHVDKTLKARPPRPENGTGSGGAT